MLSRDLAQLVLEFDLELILHLLGAAFQLRQPLLEFGDFRFFLVELHLEVTS